MLLYHISQTFPTYNLLELIVILEFEVHNKTFMDIKTTTTTTTTTPLKLFFRCK